MPEILRARDFAECANSDAALLTDMASLVASLLQVACSLQDASTPPNPDVSGEAHLSTEALTRRLLRLERESRRVRSLLEEEEAALHVHAPRALTAAAARLNAARATQGTRLTPWVCVPCWHVCFALPIVDNGPV
jgi:hypothetical protein